MKRFPTASGAGFTLVELIITVAIVAILATVAMPMMELVVKRNKEHELRQSLRDIRDAIDVYKRYADSGRIEKSAGASGYPPNLNVLVEGAEDRQSPKRAQIYFLRRMPRDPFTADTGVSPEDTWGKRSYQSEPEEPQEGEDVFDVYSLSEGVGLNGIPYRQW